MSKNRRQRRRAKHDNKAPRHVSGAALAGQVLTLEGEDKPLPPDQVFDLEEIGKKYDDGKARFVTRKADPMRAFTPAQKKRMDFSEPGKVRIQIPKAVWDKVERVRREGESEIEVSDRLIAADGRPSYPKGTAEYDAAMAITEALRKEGLGYGYAPHGTRERAVAEEIDSVLKAMPHEDRIGALLRASTPAGMRYLRNQGMTSHLSTIGTAAERHNEKINRALRNAGMRPEGEIDAAAALGGMMAVRAALQDPAAIEKLDRAVETLLAMPGVHLTEDQRRRIIDARDARDPRGVRDVIDERLSDIAKEEGFKLQEDKYLQVLEEVARMVATPTLGKVNDSCFHKVLEHWRDKDLLVPIDDKGVPLLTPKQLDDLSETMQEIITETGIFLLQHDWAAAFSKAQDFDGGAIQLPYKQTVFECMLGGNRVVVTIALADEDKPMAILHGQLLGKWSILGTYRLEHGTLAVHPDDPKDMCTPLMELLAGQIRAVCIALEAEVAVTDIVRAPHRLNQKREAKGRLPLYDYHVVSLSHRTRYAPRLAAPGDIEAEHRHRRLHFVRGHFRHYENHKVFVRWHLRGEPDLGFIDKEYRL